MYKSQLLMIFNAAIGCMLEILIIILYILIDYQVVNHSTSPEWKEGFTWAFDVPPKGQKLHILCKSKSTFGKVIN